jgi:CTP:molybdopterin cytidylyltransferase MocA
VIVGIVLAAGRSERMGTLKPLLPCGRTNFLGAVLDTLAASGVDDVRVILGHGAQEVRSATALREELFRYNPDHAAGMLTSVQCGIRSLPRGTRGFLIWPVDHPLVTAETVDSLLLELSRGEPAVVLPVHHGRRGHPVLFAADLAMELMEAPASEGARAVVRAHRRDRIEVEVDDPGVVTDIDTPEAYAAAFGAPPG